MSLFRKATKPLARKLWVIHFSSTDWGFTDASMPKVRSLLASLGDEDVEVFHSGLTVRFRGAENKEDYERCKTALEELLPLPEFGGFKIGVAEGESESIVDDSRIGFAAAKNAKA